MYVCVVVGTFLSLFNAVKDPPCCYTPGSGAKKPREREIAAASSPRSYLGT